MINNHIENLSNYFKNKKVVIAYSGGLDSTVLLEFAMQNAKEVHAITVKSSLVPQDEQDFAVEYLEARNIQFKVLQLDPLQHPKVVNNDERRCYYCKKLIFESIIEESKNFKPDIIIEGSNTTDLSDYRPGLDAIKELKVNSPFLEFQISKSEIRGLAQILSLDIAEKPATTCLATRIPYGHMITEGKLEKIEAAEKIIKDAIPVSVLRVRDHGEIARIEVSAEDFEKFFDIQIRNSIKENLKELGFSYITLDISGYKQGSMNINIEGVENN
ncbi:MAG: ATP-dependent sacrificial sulfur transferase LarE [Candidatus Heimdallarchaeota archaeon]|nr:ATP-dependent sacrificial sulfur transferase LarE [Candidatus Heimdallarchaeota archaeon]